MTTSTMMLMTLEAMPRARVLIHFAGPESFQGRWIGLHWKANTKEKVRPQQSCRIPVMTIITCNLEAAKRRCSMSRIDTLTVVMLTKYSSTIPYCICDFVAGACQLPLPCGKKWP